MSSLIWDITPRKSAVVSEGTCHLHIQGLRVSQARNQHKAGSKQIFRAEDMRSGGGRFLLNVDNLPGYTAPHPITVVSSHNTVVLYCN
jgi:hypothetical protein